MPEESRTISTVRFGPFELSTDTGELRKNGIRIKLFGQPIKVLTLLLATPGQVVTREQLQKSLWPGDTFGDLACFNRSMTLPTPLAPSPMVGKEAISLVLIPCRK